MKTTSKALLIYISTAGITAVLTNFNEISALPFILLGSIATSIFLLKNFKELVHAA